METTNSFRERLLKRLFGLSYSEPLYADRNSSVIDVKPNKAPYYKEKGWRENGRFVKGWFRCPYGAWRGLIEKTPSGRYKFYIFNPPAELRKHSHWQCFHYTGDGEKYFIHFSNDSQSIDGGIMSIQRILHESMQNRR